MATTPAANPPVPVPPDQVLLMLSLPPNNYHMFVKEENHCTMISGVGRLSSAVIPHKEVLSDGACERSIMWWQCYVKWFMFISNYSP